MNAGPKPQMYLNLKDTATTIRSMETKPLNADPSSYGHQTRKEAMKIRIIVIITQDIAAITIKNMDISLRTTLENILVETTIDG